MGLKAFFKKIQRLHCTKGRNVLNFTFSVIFKFKDTQRTGNEVQKMQMDLVLLVMLVGSEAELNKIALQ